MELCMKWLLAVLILADLTLVPSGHFNLSETIDCGAALTFLLLLVIFRQLRLTRQQYRRSRRAGCDGWFAGEQALSVILPRRLTCQVLHGLRQVVIRQRFPEQS